MFEMVASARGDPALVVLEGFHAVKHALRFGADVVALATPDRAGLMAMVAALAPDLADRLSDAEDLGREGFTRLSPHPIPTPALAVALRPHHDPATVIGAGGRVVLLDRPNHLGNLGAVIRVAAAAGAAAVVTTGDRDPWDPAALRGSAGLHFALPVVRVSTVPDRPRPLVALDPGGTPLMPGMVPATALLAFGSERRGLDAGLLAGADLWISIAMRPGVSSLNLATAAAVILYS